MGLPDRVALKQLASINPSAARGIIDYAGYILEHVSAGCSRWLSAEISAFIDLPRYKSFPAM